MRSYAAPIRENINISFARQVPNGCRGRINNTAGRRAEGDRFLTVHIDDVRRSSIYACRKKRKKINERPWAQRFLPRAAEDENIWGVGCLPLINSGLWSARGSSLRCSPEPKSETNNVGNDRVLFFFKNRWFIIEKEKQYMWRLVCRQVDRGGRAVFTERFRFCVKGFFFFSLNVQLIWLCMISAKLFTTERKKARRDTFF